MYPNLEGNFSRAREADILETVLPLPTVEEQADIIAAHKKLLDIQKAVEAFDNELAINPITSISILKKMASILDIIKK